MIGFPNAYTGDPSVKELQHDMHPRTGGYTFTCSIDHAGYLVSVTYTVSNVAFEKYVNCVFSPTDASVHMDSPDTTAEGGYTVSITVVYWNGAAELTEQFRYTIGGIS